VNPRVSQIMKGGKMISREFDDETLMAFADGELDEETAAAVEKAIGTNEALARRVALFVQTRVDVKEALRPLVEEPVPERLSQSVLRMIDEAKRHSVPSDESEALPRVVALKANDSREPSPQRSWIMPLAASLVAIACGIGGYLVGIGNQDPQNGLQVAGLNSSALTEALRRLPSGEEVVLADSNDRIRVVASFWDESGAFCREFEVDSSNRSTLVSVACLSGDAWAVNFAVATPVSDGGYAPASSTEALDAYLAASGAHEPLSREDEADALRSLGQEQE
jgi:anti-sigma factor RsiW